MKRLYTIFWQFYFFDLILILDHFYHFKDIKAIYSNMVQILPLIVLLVMIDQVYVANSLVTKNSYLYFILS